MKFLRNFLDRIEPNFKKGGKFHLLWPLYDAIETQYSVDKPNYSAPYVRDPIDSKRSMFFVVIALIPCLIYGAFNIGYIEDSNREILDNLFVGLQVLIPIYIVTFVSGGLVESIFAIIRRHEINEGFLVTGMLIPLIMPPEIPLWMVSIATIFGTLIGKEIFGGTGYNVFNPALVARAFIFFGYPAYISGDKVWSVSKIPGTVDSVSMPTPLLRIANAEVGSYLDALKEVDWMDLFFGRIPGSIGETSTIMVIVGAVFLILTRLINWRILVSIFIGMFVISSLSNLFFDYVETTNLMLSVPWYYHIVMGGFMFGAVFMATEPVTSAHTNGGRWVYGFLIGSLCILIRNFNPAYPEGMMLAILFANASASFIDYVFINRNINRRKDRIAVQQ